MSHISSLLSRPSTLGVIAVAGSGAFYLGLKGRTIVAKQQARSESIEGAAAGGQDGAKSTIGDSGSTDKNYHVRAGERSGGGI